MGRFLLRLVTRRWGWTLIGALIVLSGVLWGVSSPLIPYETSLSRGDTSQTTYIVGPHSGDLYLWTTAKNPTFYVARASDFTNPPIDFTKVHLETRLDFVDRSDLLAVNVDLDQNIHVSQVHIIESITFYNSSSQVIATYNANGYTPNSSGYFDNRWWPGGSATIVVGVLVAGIALFARRKKRGSKEVDPSTPGWPFVNIPPYPTGQLSSHPQGQNPPTP